MLDIKFIRENAQLIKENNRNRHNEVDVDRLLQLDETNRDFIGKIESLRAEQKKKSVHQPTEAEREELKKLREEIQSLETQAAGTKEELHELLLKIPNLTHPKTPNGKDDSENVETEVYGKVPTFDFTPKDHVELGKDLDIIDFAKGSDVSGQGFFYFKKQLVQLEYALLHYAIDTMVKKGYMPISTPDMVRTEAMTGTGYNPRGNEDQIYEIKDEDLSLIATAEIPIAAYHADTVFSQEQLPMKYVGLSHCFRREAGAYGKESRGLYRVHQFAKAELFIFCTPEQSEELHKELKQIEIDIYTQLGLAFRVLEICTGDLGAAAYRKYDLEAWMPMKNGWGEVTSCSNCTDYQSRRLKIKYKKNEGQSMFVHTLNGTAVTTSRTILAILENYQQADGSIIIPEVLRPYCGFDRIVK